MELILDGQLITLRHPQRGFHDWIRFAGSKSFYLAKKIVELVFGGVAYTAPTHVYLALLTAVPDDTSTGATITETDYASYARTEIGTGNNQTDAFNAATGSTTATVTNKNAISAPSATGASTNPLVAIALLDSATIGAGNVLGWATITSTPIAVGDTPKVNAGALSAVED